MTLKIGLTGGIGSGKTTAAHFFSELGTPVIDADVIAHELTETGSPALKKMAAYFGPSIVSNKQLDRARLRQLIFQDSEKKAWLEQLLHPMILENMQEKANNLEENYCIMAIPLLTEIGHLDYIDRILVIDCPEHLQIERVKQRNNLREADIRAILNSQATRDARRAIANDIICNDDTPDALQKQITELHRYYMTLSNPQSIS